MYNSFILSQQKNPILSKFDPRFFLWKDFSNNFNS
jgi:hypothetical protein